MVLIYQQTHLKKKCFLIKLGQSEPAPTSAPTWMDGALIGFSFLSLCHPRLTFSCLPFLSPDLSFSLQLYFLPAPHPVSVSFNFETFPTHPPTHLTTDLPTNTLSRYLPNPTYMATPTYMVAKPPTVDNNEKRIR
jgi:hypothetical protein